MCLGYFSYLCGLQSGNDYKIEILAFIIVARRINFLIVIEFISNKVLSIDNQASNVLFDINL